MKNILSSSKNIIHTLNPIFRDISGLNSINNTIISEIITSKSFYYLFKIFSIIKFINSILSKAVGKKAKIY